MEGRISRLESDVTHIQKDVADIKVDLKRLQDKVEAGFTDNSSIDRAAHCGYGEGVWESKNRPTSETRVWG